VNAWLAVLSFYPQRFEREMACAEREWLAWLPAAIGCHRYVLQPGSARIFFDTGELRLNWQVLEPRAMALIRLPRLQTTFEFHGVTDDARQAFMRRFDLYMQRGGG